MESFRNIDMKAEEQLATFLDNYFYSKLQSQNGELIKYTRKRDKESQLKGIDVELNVNDRRFVIDEKASLYYSNAMIPTFAFEIDSIQKGHQEPVEGWFVNNQLLTEFYLLIWPNIKCERQNKQWIRKDINKIETSDFTIVEAMLIKKSVLQEEIEKHKDKGEYINKAYLLEYAKRLRAVMNNSAEKKSEKIDDDIKIVYSGTIAEKPINVVIQKRLLKSIASATYLISEDGYAKI